MIIDFLLMVVSGILRGLLTLLPDLPDTPTFVSDAGAYITGLAEDGAGFVFVFLGNPLYAGALAIVVGIFLFENVWHGVQWVWHKVRGA